MEKNQFAASKIRTSITQLRYDFGPSILDGMYGIKLLLKSGVFTENTNCFNYIFGHDDQLLERVAVTISTGEKIETPEPLALTVYGSPRCLMDVKHVGIVTPDLNTISKWGHGPVFEHPPDHTLVEYGPVEFLRVDINKIYGYCHPTLTKFLEERKTI